jgi:glycosyltransferase involved in cell wall biosynthesis
MMQNGPLISIVLPCYNGEKFLAQSIQSCIDQEYQNWELLLVNDCSTDNSYKIMLDYAKNNSRIKIIDNKKNLKLPTSLNAGFDAAQGEYFTWTSDDNYYLPNALNELLKAILGNNADAVYSGYYIIDEKGEIIDKHMPLEPENMICHSVAGASFLYKRSVHETLKGYNANMFLIEDYDFWLRMYLFGYKIITLNLLFYCYRTHSNSLTNMQSSKIIKATYQRVVYNYKYLNKFPSSYISVYYDYIFKKAQYIGINDLFFLFSNSIMENPKFSIELIYSCFFRKIILLISIIGNFLNPIIKVYRRIKTNGCKNTFNFYYLKYFKSKEKA